MNNLFSHLPEKHSAKHAVRALTVVELLVVIGVLAILAVLLFPALRGMAERSASVNCMTNMRSLGAILQAYRADHDGYFPTGIEGQRLIDLATKAEENPQSGASVTKGLRDGGYIPAGNEALYCPAMKVSDQGLEHLKKSGKTPIQHLKETGSYAINIRLLQVKPAALIGQYWWGTNTYPGDSKMVFLSEHHAGIGGRWEGMIWVNPDTALNGVNYGSSINVKGRHHGNHRLNFMFLDGHIEQVAPVVRADGSYYWDDVMDSWGRNGKYIKAQRLRASE